MDKQALVYNRSVVKAHYKTLIREIRGLKEKLKRSFRDYEKQLNGIDAVNLFKKGQKQSSRLSWKRKEARHVFLILNYLRGNSYSEVENEALMNFDVDHRLLDVLVNRLGLNFHSEDYDDLHRWFKGTSLLNEYLVSQFGVKPPVLVAA